MPGESWVVVFLSLPDHLEPSIEDMKAVFGRPTPDQSKETAKIPTPRLDEREEYLQS